MARNLLFLLLCASALGQPVVEVRGGVMKVEGEIVFDLNTSLKLSDGAVLESDDGATMVFSADRQVNAVDIVGDGVTIRNVNFRGLWMGDPKMGVNGDGPHGISIRGRSNILLDRVSAQNFFCDGLYIGSSPGDRKPGSNIRVVGSVFDWNRRQGASVVSGTGIVFEGCTFAHTKGAAPQSGIDIEPNNGGDPIEVTVRNCHSYGHPSGPPYLVSLSRAQTTGPPPVIRFIGCTYSEVAANMPYLRMADCFRSRIQKNADGTETVLRANDGFPADNLPKGTLVEWDGFPLVHVR